MMIDLMCQVCLTAFELLLSDHVRLEKHCHWGYTGMYVETAVWGWLGCATLDVCRALWICQTGETPAFATLGSFLLDQRNTGGFSGFVCHTGSRNTGMTSSQWSLGNMDGAKHREKGGLLQEHALASACACVTCSFHMVALSCLHIVVRLWCICVLAFAWKVYGTLLWHVGWQLVQDLDRQVVGVVLLAALLPHTLAHGMPERFWTCARLHNWRCQRWWNWFQLDVRLGNFPL